MNAVQIVHISSALAVGKRVILEPTTPRDCPVLYSLVYDLSGNSCTPKTFLDLSFRENETEPSVKAERIDEAAMPEADQNGLDKPRSRHVGPRLRADVEHCKEFGVTWVSRTICPGARIVVFVTAM
jgi:hypothetical protein